MSKTTTVPAEHIQEDGVLVFDDSTIHKVTKTQLLHYLLYLLYIIPNGFMKDDLLGDTTTHNIQLFVRKVAKKRKMEIVDIINYGIMNRHIHRSVVVKHNAPANNLVRVTVKESVNKIV